MRPSYRVAMTLICISMSLWQASKSNHMRTLLVAPHNSGIRSYDALYQPVSTVHLKNQLTEKDVVVERT